MDPPRRFAWLTAELSSVVMRPLRRCAFAMKKQVTLQPPAASSTGRSFRDAARPAYSERGAIAHHPTGSPPRYARSPGSAPDATQARRLALRFAGGSARNSEYRRRRSIHQQFEYAPFGPKSFSRSCQRLGLTGWISVTVRGTPRSFLQTRKIESRWTAASQQTAQSDDICAERTRSAARGARPL